MANININDAKAWTEPTKVGDNFDTLDADLEAQVSQIILGQLGQRFSIVGWLAPESTPKLVKTIIAMYYVSYLYDKTYSTDDNASAYAVILRNQADLNLAGLISGNIDLPEVPESTGFDTPSFYPNDASSMQDPTYEDPSLGPASFSMGRTF